jgi:2-dehydropantoate 2-reductase
MTIKRIETVSIIGLGALGILFGHHLSKKMPFKALSIIADQKRIKGYIEKPVYCNNEKCSFNFVLPEKKGVPADLAIFTVKFGSLNNAIHDMRNQIGKDTIILSALNGISSEDFIGRSYGFDNILYCVAQGMDGIRIGNSLKYKNMGMLCFGDRKPDIISEKTEAVTEFFLRTDFPHEVKIDMGKRMWGKFMLNVGVNQAISVYGGTYGAIQTDGVVRDTMIKAMEEVIKISHKEGFPQTYEDLNYWLEVVMALSPDGKPSMAQDIEAKRMTEVELFSGTVIRLGKKHGISTPVNQFLYDRIKSIECRF